MIYNINPLTTIHPVCPKFNNAIRTAGNSTAIAKGLISDKQ